MAKDKATSHFITFLSALSLVLLHVSNGETAPKCTIKAIYQIGDSQSDTGNFLLEIPGILIGKPPYGETYFHRPTGRCSNGLLMVDYIAEKFGLPFLEPYLSRRAVFRNGVNFAVSGASALPAHVLAQKNISSTLTNSSLSTQLQWMFSRFDKMCYKSQDCVEKIESALFIVGEIGGNDINFALTQGKPLKEIKALVHDVVHAIKYAVTRIISYGAVRVVVPGNYAFGCFPFYLTSFRTDSPSAYDELHCLKWLNDLSAYYNRHLKRGFKELNNKYPNVSIVYGDLYNLHLQLLRNASHLGFDSKSRVKSCCGIGGDYNFDPTRICASPGVPVCPNPNKSINWDGYHLTQKANQYMTQWLLRDILPKLHC